MILAPKHLNYDPKNPKHIFIDSRNKILAYKVYRLSSKDIDILINFTKKYEYIHTFRDSKNRLINLKDGLAIADTERCKKINETLERNIPIIQWALAVKDSVLFAEAQNNNKLLEIFNFVQRIKHPQLNKVMQIMHSTNRTLQLLDRIKAQIKSDKSDVNKWQSTPHYLSKQQIFFLQKRINTFRLLGHKLEVEIARTFGMETTKRKAKAIYDVGGKFNAYKNEVGEMHGYLHKSLAASKRKLFYYSQLQNTKKSILKRQNTPEFLKELPQIISSLKSQVEGLERSILYTKKKVDNKLRAVITSANGGNIRSQFQTASGFNQKGFERQILFLYSRVFGGSYKYDYDHKGNLILVRARIQDSNMKIDLDHSITGEVYREAHEIFKTQNQTYDHYSDRFDDHIYNKPNNVVVSSPLIWYGLQKGLSHELATKQGMSGFKRFVPHQEQRGQWRYDHKSKQVMFDRMDKDFQNPSSYRRSDKRGVVYTRDFEAQLDKWSTIDFNRHQAIVLGRAAPADVRAQHPRWQPNSPWWYSFGKDQEGGHELPLSPKKQRDKSGKGFGPWLKYQQLSNSIGNMKSADDVFPMIKKVLHYFHPEGSMAFDMYDTEGRYLSDQSLISNAVNGMHPAAWGLIKEIKNQARILADPSVTSEIEDDISPFSEEYRNESNMKWAMKLRQQREISGWEQMKKFNTDFEKIGSWNWNEGSPSNDERFASESVGLTTGRRGQRSLSDVDEIYHRRENIKGAYGRAPELVQTPTHLMNILLEEMEDQEHLGSKFRGIFGLS